MFEHSIYEPEPVATPTEEGDLFHNYEIKNWDLSKRIYQILGVSAAVNLLALLVFSTTSVLTMKGCDSPLVGNVCQVLDTIYVGSKLFGTDREYVDAVYDKTELGDADVTFVDVSGETPPISYPEGYFQIANPEQFQAMVEQANNPIQPGFIAPGIPITTPSTGNSIIDTPQRLPKPNPNPIAGDLPSGFGDAGSNPTIRKGRRGGRVKPPVPDQDDTAKVEPTPKPTVEPSEPVTDYVINKRPFTDLADEVNKGIKNKEVNLEAEFTVTAKGKLTKTGKLDSKTFKFTRAASSDPKIVDVVKKSIEAFNDSGMLQYLEGMSGKDLNLTVAQDKENVAAEVRSEVEQEARATSLATALRVGRDFAIGRKKEKIAKLQAANKPEEAEALQNAMDELELLTKTEIVAEGKQLVVRFTSPKTAIQNLIQRKLEAQAKEVGSGKTDLGNNTARN